MQLFAVTTYGLINKLSSKKKSKKETEKSQISHQEVNPLNKGEVGFSAMMEEM